MDRWNSIPIKSINQSVCLSETLTSVPASTPGRRARRSASRTRTRRAAAEASRSAATRPASLQVSKRACLHTCTFPSPLKPVGRRGWGLRRNPNDWCLCVTSRRLTHPLSNLQNLLFGSRSVKKNDFYAMGTGQQYRKLSPAERRLPQFGNEAPLHGRQTYLTKGHSAAAECCGEPLYWRKNVFFKAKL